MPAILDLRAGKRAEQEADAQSRIANLKAMEAAGEYTVTAGTLDRQGVPNPSVNQVGNGTDLEPKNEKKKWNWRHPFGGGEK